MKYNNNKLEEEIKHSILQIIPQDIPLPDSKQLFQKDDLSYAIGWNTCLIEVKSRLGLYPDTSKVASNETPNTNSAQLSSIKSSIIFN